MAERRRLVLALLAPLLLAGCASDPREGWSTASIHRTDVTTVSVPIFENATFERDVRYELTDAVIKEIEARTPYRVVPTREAQTVLRGRIADVRYTELSRSRRTGLSEEVGLQVTVDLEWTRITTGEVLLEQRGFTGSGLFVASAPNAEREELGRFDAVAALARDIVDAMQSAW